MKWMTWKSVRTNKIKAADLHESLMLLGAIFKILETTLLFIAIIK
jgi:hypothetical protein